MPYGVTRPQCINTTAWVQRRNWYSAGIILCMRSANRKRSYDIMSSIFGWVWVVITRGSLFTAWGQKVCLHCTFWQYRDIWNGNNIGSHYMISFSCLRKPHSSSEIYLLQASHRNGLIRFGKIPSRMMTSSKDTFSASLAICAENSPVTVEFPTQRPVTRSFDIFFDLRLNKRLSKQSWGWWLRRHRAIMTSF